jgi:hypothetical protein
MIGRSARQDQPVPVLDAVDRFGAGTLYREDIARPFRLTPLAAPPFWSTLNASNKASEHNPYNVLPRIVVAQLAGQTTAPDLSRRISHRIVLRPGNQSLGGT